MGLSILASATPSITSQIWTDLQVVFTQMLTWVGNVLTALVNPAQGGPDLTALVPFLAIPIAFSVIGFGIGVIKRIIG